MRIAVVNDLGLAVEALRRTVALVPKASLAWIARDGREAVERAASDPPDLILMDMVMPVMDGVEATQRILAKAPIPILVVTASIRGNQERVYKALGAGAIDVAATPRLSPGGEVLGAEALLRKIAAAATLSPGGGSSPPATAAHAIRTPASPQRQPATEGRRAAPTAPGEATPADPPLLAIGASTGGPQALVDLLRGLPRPLGYRVLIAQHVDPQFAPGLATWLATESGHAVRPLRHGEVPACGDVLLGTSGDHVVVGDRGAARYAAEPRETPFRPSVDVLFLSLASARIAPGVAVLLTGMGRDGAEGLLALRRCGWTTIAQDQATSVVWGMPGAAVACGAATMVLPLPQIAGAVESAMRAAMRRASGQMSSSIGSPSLPAPRSTPP